MGGLEMTVTGLEGWVVDGITARVAEAWVSGGRLCRGAADDVTNTDCCWGLEG